MSETCILCRRPKWVAIPGAMGVSPGVCAADVVCHLGVMGRNALDCRTRALTVAALVAPVVEAAEEILAGSIVDREEDEAALAAAFNAMRDVLAKLSKP